MNENVTVELRPGMLVFSADGDELGRVKKLEGDCFLVDAPLRVDYWLPASTVDSTESGVARLSLPKSAFNQRKVLDVGHAGIHRHQGS